MALCAAAKARCSSWGTKAAASNKDTRRATEIWVFGNCPGISVFLWSWCRTPSAPLARDKSQFIPEWQKSLCFGSTKFEAWSRFRWSVAALLPSIPVGWVLSTRNSYRCPKAKLWQETSWDTDSSVFCTCRSTAVTQSRGWNWNPTLSNGSSSSTPH